MLKRAVIIAISFLSIFGVIAFFVLFQFDDKANTHYRNLEISSRPAQAQNELHYTEHTRKKVVKELFSDRQIPEKVRVYSESSELFFMGEEKNIEVIEEMQDVHCFLQEELYYLLPNGKKLPSDASTQGHPGIVPMQKLCLMKAESATFYYSSNTLLAEKVKMWKYEARGHLLPSSFTHLVPIMEGEANTVEIAFQNDEVKMIASPFKAKFDIPDKKGFHA